MLSKTPVVTEMQVIPVAGYDSMEMTLSGAHAPFFTRNLVIIKDSSGHTGIGEIHGGEYTCECLNACIPLVVGQEIGKYRAILGAIHRGGKEGGRRRRGGNPDPGHQQAQVCGESRVGY